MKFKKSINLNSLKHYRRIILSNFYHWHWHHRITLANEMEKRIGQCKAKWFGALREFALSLVHHCILHYTRASWDINIMKIISNCVNWISFIQLTGSSSMTGEKKIGLMVLVGVVEVCANKRTSCPPVQMLCSALKVLITIFISRCVYVSGQRISNKLLCS